MSIPPSSPMGVSQKSHASYHHGVPQLMLVIASILLIVCAHAEAANNTVEMDASLPPPALGPNTTVETLLDVCNNSTKYRHVQKLSVEDEDATTIAGLVTTSFADVTKIPNLDMANTNASTGVQELIMACNPMVDKAVQDIDVITACQVEEDSSVKYYIVEFRTVLPCTGTTMGGTPQEWSVQVLTLVEIKPKSPIFDSIVKIALIG